MRDTGAKSAPGGQTAEGEDGFGDVLSKLQNSDSDEPALPKDHPRAGERTNARRHTIEAQLVPEGSRADPNVGSVPDVSDNDLQLLSDPQLDGAVTVQSDPLGLIATVPNGVAGVAPLNLVPSSAKNEPGAPTLFSSPPQSADPTAAAGETRSVTFRQTEAGLQLPAEATAKGELGNIDHLATASDPALARLAPLGTANDKDKLERAQRSRTPVTSMDISTPQAANGAAALVQRHEISAAIDRPNASVQRQETHFAPLSTVGPQASVSVGDGSKSATPPEAYGGEAAAAPDLVAAALPSFEDSSSIAMPPAQQIAGRIAAEATSAPEFAERTDMAPPMQQGMKPALKILQIQLQPADLGTVTVRMELKDTELTLHVGADRKETADLIRNDQDTLTNLLRSAGYNVDTGSVRIMDDRTLSSQQPGQQGAQTNLQSSAQSQSGASDRQGHAQRGGTGTNGGDTGHQTGRNDTNETTTNRPGRGVYV
ncbi:flagellar hook-length control protein FliK [Hyphomicrobium album]|uniref:flagellar hook-length control protein FliK n=1 Tax=Hyphomicrobium album TaxID=2665159 RepID=UPI0018AAF2B6|nr:flagellar hook-length control protein FliK [Hyphomicrobium album]